MVVTMQKGAYGKTYRNASNVPVTKDGQAVGFGYLVEGMPITLELQNNKLMEIRVRTTGGNRK
jgi:hypothetical protein